MSERSSRFKLLLVGVGGQGVLTAARFLGEAALASDREVVLGQLHGMSQRGGSVESTVLIGPGESSFIGPGQADAVLALEPLEALRARSRMSSRTRVVVNTGKVVPFTLAQQGRDYPDLEGILEDIRAVTSHVTTVDGPAVVTEVGNPRVLNITMLGALAALDLLPLPEGALLATVEKLSPSPYLVPNRRAFELGMEAVCS